MKNKLFRVLSLFDGIAGARQALKELNIDCEYYASEVDKYAIQVAKSNHPDIVHLGDVKTVKNYNNVDLLIGGSPCQDLSIAKKDRKGLEGDRSSLFYEYLRILNKVQPKYFILENVASMSKESKAIITQELGVQPLLINSDRFVQQNRQRLYWTNIAINALPARTDWQGTFYQWRRTYFRKNKSGVCPTLTANMGTGGHNVPLKSQNLQDKLTTNEVCKLQGFPDNYVSMVSNTQGYKALGNSFTVPVIKHILTRFIQL